jgi:hypothetical protein
MKKVMYKKLIPIQYEQLSNGNKKVVEGTGKFQDEFSSEGVFITWGTNYAELSNGVGQYSIAIVQTPEGLIEGVHISNLKFVTE